MGEKSYPDLFTFSLSVSAVDVHSPWDAQKALKLLDIVLEAGFQCNLYFSLFSETVREVSSLLSTRQIDKLDVAEVTEDIIKGPLKLVLVISHCCCLTFHTGGSSRDKGACSSRQTPLGVTTVPYDVISFPCLLFFSRCPLLTLQLRWMMARECVSVHFSTVNKNLQVKCDTWEINKLSTCEQNVRFELQPRNVKMVQTRCIQMSHTHRKHIHKSSPAVSVSMTAYQTPFQTPASYLATPLHFHGDAIKSNNTHSHAHEKNGRWAWKWSEEQREWR